MGGVAEYAPFVRKIFIVSDGQRPAWIASHPKIVFVDQRDLIPRDKTYPVFSSLAIETYLHRIDGLSRFFLYSNDDMFFGRPCVWSDFVNGQGRARIRFESAWIYRVPPFADFLHLHVLYRSGRLLQRNWIFPYWPAFEKRRHYLRWLFTGTYLPYRFDSHQVDIFCRDAGFEIERRFSKEIAQTRNWRFRHPQSVSPCFLMRNISVLRGWGAFELADPSSRLLVSSDWNAERLDQLLRSTQSVKWQAPQFFCLNQTGPVNAHWRRFVQGYLQRTFPAPCEFELPVVQYNHGVSPV